MFRKVIAIISCLTLLSGGIVSVKAQNDTVQLVDFNTFDNGNGGWAINSSGAGADIQTKTEGDNIYMDLSQTASGNTYYLKKFNTDNSLGSGVINNEATMIVGKVSLVYYGGGNSSSTSDYVEYGMTNNTGDRLRLVRVAANNKVSIHRGLRNTTSDSYGGKQFKEGNERVINSSYVPGTWVNAIYVIDVDDSGVGTFTYYVDGVKYDAGTRDFTLADMNTSTATHAAVTIKSTGGNMIDAGVDNLGLYYVKSDDIPQFSAELEKNADIASDENIVIDFSNEIYKDEYDGKIMINSETVESSRITLGADQKSLIIAPPSNGFEENASYTVEFDSFSDIFGLSLQTDELTFSTVSSGDEFKISDFNGGKKSDIDISSDLNITFTKELDADMFDGKIILEDKNGNETYIGASSMSVDSKTLTLSALDLKENTSYTLKFNNENSYGANGSLTGNNEYSFDTHIFKLASITPSMTAMPASGGYVDFSFTSPVDVSQLYGKIRIDNITVGNDSIIQQSGSVIRVLCGELTADKTYTIDADTNITNANGTLLYDTAIIYSFKTASGSMLSVYSDYSDIVTAPTANGNTYAGSISVEKAEDVGTMLKLGPANSGDVHNMLTAGKAFTELENGFIYETKLKLSGSTGQLRLRFQKAGANDSVSNNVLYFRNGKFSLRERNYGNGYDASKIIEVGSYREEVWYSLRVYFDMTSSKPYMNVFLIADDGKENYAEYNVDITPSMLALGNNAWNIMTNVGTYLQNGSSNSMIAYEKFQNIYETSSAVATGNIAYGAVNVSEDIDPQYSFTAPVTTNGADIKMLCNGNTQTAEIKLADNGKTVEIIPASGIAAGAQYEISGTIKDCTGTTVTLPEMKYTVKAEELWGHDVTSSLSGNALSVSGIIDNKSDKTSSAEAIIVLYEEINGKYKQIRQTTKEISATALTSNITFSLSMELTDDEKNAVDGKYIAKAMLIEKNTYNQIMNTVDVFSSGQSRIENEFDFTVNITGEVNSKRGNKRTTLCIFTKDSDLTSIPTFDSESVVCIMSGMSDDNGSYAFNPIMNDEFPSGVYPYMVTSNDGTTVKQSFTYVNAKHQKEFIEAVNKAVSAADFLNIAEPIEYKAGIVNPLMEKVGMNGIYEYLYTKLPYDSDNPSEFSASVDEALIIGALNEKLSEAVENGKLCSLDIIGKAPTGNADRFITLYNSSLSDAGVKKVNEMMMGKGFTALLQAQNEFALSTVLNAICNNSALGYNYVTSLLLDNAALLGLDLSGYTASRRSTINKYLIDHKAYTKSELLNNYNIALNNAKANETTGGGGGGGAGSGSGSGGNKTSGNAIGAGTTLVNPIVTDKSEGNSFVFNDMDNYEWAKEAVKTLTDEGVVSKSENGKFNPFSNITREEFVKLAVELFKINSSDINIDFDDVNSGAWYEGYVKTAVAEGIINGIDETHFGSGMNISRQDIAVIVYRAMHKYSSLSTDGEENEAIADESNIADYAVESVKILKQNRIINGYDDLTFRPTNLCTRAEAAVILYNVFNVINK